MFIKDVDVSPVDELNLSLQTEVSTIVNFKGTSAVSASQRTSCLTIETPFRRASDSLRGEGQSFILCSTWARRATKGMRGNYFGTTSTVTH